MDLETDHIWWRNSSITKIRGSTLYQSSAFCCFSPPSITTPAPLNHCRAYSLGWYDLPAEQQLQTLCSDTRGMPPPPPPSSPHHRAARLTDSKLHLLIYSLRTQLSTCLAHSSKIQFLFPNRLLQKLDFLRACSFN